MTPSQAAHILYTNWKSETAWRRILPKDWSFGTSKRYPIPQWLLQAWDYDKEAERTFAVKDILKWEPLE